MKSNRGFTLMEVLIVMALLGIIFSLAAFINLDAYRGSSFRNERDTLVGVLEEARSQAMNGICVGGSCTDSKPYGVHITSTNYTIFQGATYATRDTTYDDVVAIGPLVSIASGSFTDVIFAQLSGDATTLPAGATSTTITDGMGHTSVISVSSFGQVTWTN